MHEDRGIVLPDSRIRAAREGGFWHDKTILDFFEDDLAKTPDGLAIVDYNSMTGQYTRLTYRELDKRVAKLAVGFASLGIQPDDIISCQMPNWWQLIAVHLAAMRIGAITNPLVSIFRERELEFMLGWAKSRLLIVPETFRGFDHLDLANKLADRLPDLLHVLFLGRDGKGSFDELLDREIDEDEARTLFAARRPSADGLVTIMYTSGTTGQPKGVMHTSNTLFCNLIQFQRDQRLDATDVTIMPSPLAHQTGFLYGVMQPILIGGPVVLQDIWHAGKALDLVESEKVTFTISATPFLADYCEAARDRREAVESLRVFVSAGAPIPRDLARRANDILGARIVSMWGMTENGPACYTLPEDPPEKIYETDGCPNKAMAVRIVGDDDKPLPADAEGRLKVLGAGMFVGYLRRPDLYESAEEGWFDTGDLARVDADGYVRITGRSKDVIIRGGENIPVVEIENLLLKHPEIAEVAIVAIPDKRLGERACAFAVLREGASITYQEMVSFLVDQNCAKQYIPERLEIVEDMPRTPSGKIQKFVLREEARGLSAER